MHSTATVIQDRTTRGTPPEEYSRDELPHVGRITMHATPGLFTSNVGELSWDDAMEYNDAQLENIVRPAICDVLTTHHVGSRDSALAKVSGVVYERLSRIMSNDTWWAMPKGEQTYWLDILCGNAQRAGEVYHAAYSRKAFWNMVRTVERATKGPSREGAVLEHLSAASRALPGQQRPAATPSLQESVRSRDDASESHTPMSPTHGVSPVLAEGSILQQGLANPDVVTTQSNPPLDGALVSEGDDDDHEPSISHMIARELETDPVDRTCDLGTGQIDQTLGYQIDPDAEETVPTAVESDINGLEGFALAVAEQKRNELLLENEKLKEENQKLSNDLATAISNCSELQATSEMSQRGMKEMAQAVDEVLNKSVDINIHEELQKLLAEVTIERNGLLDKVAILEQKDSLALETENALRGSITLLQRENHSLKVQVDQLRLQLTALEEEKGLESRQLGSAGGKTLAGQPADHPLPSSAPANRHSLAANTPSGNQLVTEHFTTTLGHMDHSQSVHSVPNCTMKWGDLVRSMPTFEEPSKTMSLQTWLWRIKKACHDQGATEAKRAEMMGHKLRGKAQQVLQTMSYEDQGDPEKITKALEAKFHSVHACEDAEASLRARTLLPGESLADFADAFETLALKAYPMDTSKQRQEVLKCFESGLATRPSLQSDFRHIKRSKEYDSVQRYVDELKRHQPEASPGAPATSGSAYQTSGHISYQPQESASEAEDSDPNQPAILAVNRRRVPKPKKPDKSRAKVSSEDQGVDSMKEFWKEELGKVFARIDSQRQILDSIVEEQNRIRSYWNRPIRPFRGRGGNNSGSRGNFTPRGNQGRGGQQNQGDKPRRGPKPTDICAACKGVGHWARDCPAVKSGDAQTCWSCRTGNANPEHHLLLCDTCSAASVSEYFVAPENC